MIQEFLKAGSVTITCEIIASFPVACFVEIDIKLTEWSSQHAGRSIADLEVLIGWVAEKRCLLIDHIVPMVTIIVHIEFSVN